MTETIKLIESLDEKMIGTRFLVKASIFDNGVNPKSIMLAVRDLVENGFSLRYFKNEDEVASFLKLLHAAAK
jgi:hypothetical protein